MCLGLLPGIFSGYQEVTKGISKALEKDCRVFRVIIWNFLWIPGSDKGASQTRWKKIVECFKLLPGIFSGYQGVTKGISNALEKECRVSNDSGSTEPIRVNTPRSN